jgi:hypothetical protein
MRPAIARLLYFRWGWALENGPAGMLPVFVTRDAIPGDLRVRIAVDELK